MRKHQRGYSLPELLTVVAIVGLIALVSVPAIFQLLPQYRMRSVTGELAATLRMTRQNAQSTRRPWRVTFDTTGTRYSIGMLNSPTAAMNVAANWVPIGSNNRPVSAANAWRSLRGMIVTAGGFVDVDTTNGPDVIFIRDGSLSPACYSSTTPAIRLHTANNLVRYNTYYMRLNPSGYLATNQTKE
jgi:prepilin-type N-terminal cleavage/methylation domain-containing protein